MISSYYTDFRDKNLGKQYEPCDSLKEESFLKKEGLSRGLNALLIPSSFLAHALDSIIGFGATMVAFFTLGNKGYTTARNNLKQFKCLASDSYIHTLRIFNPNAELWHESGFGEELIIGSLRDIAKSCIQTRENGEQKPWYLRHVVSRLLFLSLGLASVVARVIDCAIGIIALPLSFLTLGSFSVINEAAYSGLKIIGIVDDICYSLIKTINPWVKKEKEDLGNN